jgi:hypothetical protein
MFILNADRTPQFLLLAWAVSDKENPLTMGPHNQGIKKCRPGEFARQPTALHLTEQAKVV